MNRCIPCRQGFHKSCIGCECTHENNVGQPVDSEASPTGGEEEEDERPSASKHRRTRTLKRDDALKDQQSTGRKRAARWYPLDREAPCEWQGQKNCGGGLNPIVGCVGGRQQARHHGPDKSVSNNDPGNVHRICHRCHNRWHAANNKDYDWSKTTVNPHAPTPMTELEMFFVAAEDEGKTFAVIKD